MDDLFLTFLENIELHLGKKADAAEATAIQVIRTGVCQRARLLCSLLIY